MSFGSGAGVAFFGTGAGPGVKKSDSDHLWLQLSVRWNTKSRKSSITPATRHSQNRKLTPVTLSLGIATTVFG